MVTWSVKKVGLRHKKLFSASIWYFVKLHQGSPADVIVTQVVNISPQRSFLLFNKTLCDMLVKFLIMNHGML